MATRKGTDPAAASRKKPASRSSAASAAPRKGAAPAALPVCAPAASLQEAETEANKAAGLWRAGLKALDTVRQDVTRRHTNVIETLLGIAPRTEADAKNANPLLPRSFPGLEGLGLHKFEDVFDERVAAALQRLGMPTQAEIAALASQIEALAARLDRIEGASAPAAPPAAVPRKKTRTASR
jgi:hypothetical protein